jgi:hypothetical protein
MSDYLHSLTPLPQDRWNWSDLIIGQEHKAYCTFTFPENPPTAVHVFLKESPCAKPTMVSSRNGEINCTQFLFRNRVSHIADHQVFGDSGREVDAEEHASWSTYHELYNFNLNDQEPFGCE